MCFYRQVHFTACGHYIMEGINFCDHTRQQLQRINDPKYHAEPYLNHLPFYDGPQCAPIFDAPSNVSGPYTNDGYCKRCRAQVHEQMRQDQEMMAIRERQQREELMTQGWTPGPVRRQAIPLRPVNDWRDNWRFMTTTQPEMRRENAEMERRGLDWREVYGRR